MVNRRYLRIPIPAKRAFGELTGLEAGPTFYLCVTADSGGFIFVYFEDGI